MEIKHLIEAVLAVLIGLALFPAVNGAAEAALLTDNASAIVLTLIPLVPTIYVIIVVAGAAAYVYSKR